MKQNVYSSVSRSLLQLCLCLSVTPCKLLTFFISVFLTVFSRFYDRYLLSALNSLAYSTFSYWDWDSTSFVSSLPTDPKFGSFKKRFYRETLKLEQAKRASPSFSSPDGSITSSSPLCCYLAANLFPTLVTP